MSLSKKDINLITRISKSNKSVKIFFPVTITILALFFFFKLNFAIELGKMEGHSITTLVKDWVARIDLTANYSGVHIQAIHYISDAAYYLSTIVCLLVLFFTFNRLSALHKTILHALKECGQVNDSLTKDLHHL